MKLHFTRKTWYFFLLASAAVSMLNGFFVLAGQTFGLLEQIAFCLAAIAALFLAAEKGAPAKDKRNYFLVFLLLLFSYMINGWLGYLCSALAWPALLLVEYQHGKPIQRQLQLVGISEALHLLFLLLTIYGGVSAMSFWTNILWVLLACARGWIRGRRRPYDPAATAPPSCPPRPAPLWPPGLSGRAGCFSLRGGGVLPPPRHTGGSFYPRSTRPRAYSA